MNRRIGAGGALAVAALAMPPLAIFAPLGLAALLVAAVAAVLALDGRRALHGIAGLKAFAALLAALALWAILSASWSIAPQHSLLEGARFLGIAAGALVLLGAATMLDPAERGLVGGAVVAGAALAVIVLLGLAAAGVQTAHFDRGATTLALALWPAVAVLLSRRWRLLSAFLAAASALAAWLMLSQSAILALVAGAVVLGVAWRLPRIAAIGLGLGVVALALALPLRTPDADEVVALHHRVSALKNSAIHRLLIWRFAADRIAERPLLGWGMDSSRALPGGKDDLSRLVPESDLPPNAEAMPLHPHDALLEIELELGAPGAVLAVSVILLGLARAPRAPPPFAAAALAWSAAALVVALLSYGVWQPWWLSCLAIGAAELVALGAGQGEGKSTSVRPKSR